MALIYRCDLCKAIVEASEGVRKIELPHLNYYQSQFTDETDGYSRDACINCARRFAALKSEIEKESNVRAATHS